jgi:hypothetical protein
MKLSRLMMFGSAVMFAVSTTWIVPPSPASAQESDPSAVSQASDVGEARGPSDSSDSSGAQASPDTEVAPEFAAPITVTGQWAGGISDNLRGDGSFNADFIQKKGKLTGTWDAFGDFGNVVGTVNGKSARITFIFFPKRPFIHCRFTFTSTSASDSEITGTYKFSACGPLTRKEHGTIDISPAP